MKRPQGFDHVPEQVAARTRPAVPSVRRTTAAPDDNAKSVSDETMTLTADPIPSSASGEPRDAPARPSVKRSRRPDAIPDPDRELRKARRERDRYERDEVRRFTKRTRHRRWLWLGGAALAILILAGLVLVAFSPLMALRTIRIEGTSQINASDVQAAVRNELGTPLPLVDGATVRRDLAAFPLIESYSTEVVPPNTMIIRIVERTPVGVVHDGSVWHVVDAARVTLSSSASRPAGYPAIQVSGQPGSPAEVKTFTAVAEVIRALPPTLLSQVETISATTPDDVTFTLTNGPTVVWGTAAQSALKDVVLEKLMALPTAGSVSEYDVSSPSSVVTR